MLTTTQEHRLQVAKHPQPQDCCATPNVAGLNYCRLPYPLGIDVTMNEPRLLRVFELQVVTEGQNLPQLKTGWGTLPVTCQSKREEHDDDDDGLDALTTFLHTYSVRSTPYCILQYIVEVITYNNMLHTIVPFDIDECQWLYCTVCMVCIKRHMLMQDSISKGASFFQGLILYYLAWIGKSIERLLWYGFLHP